MRVSQQETYSTNNFIILQDQKWLDRQRIAGKVAAKTLLLLESLVKEKTTKSLIELDKIAEEFIVKNGCTPTFKNYKGYPNSCCISVDKKLVHSIATDECLQEGNLVSFDLGTTFENAIADTAITCIFGQAKSEKHVKLVEDTEAVLMAGINAIKVGNRLGCIGEAIYKYGIERGYGVISQYGGHGISATNDIENKNSVGIPHAAPFVSNKAELNEGIRITSGLVIAVEPMLTLGDTKTWVDKDGWTVWGKDLSSHFEHSIYIHQDRVEIITDRNNL